MRLVSGVVAGACLILAVASPTIAQRPAALEKGRMSLAFVVPDAHSGEVSIWRFASDRTNLGLGVGFGVSSIETETDRSYTTAYVRVGPMLKRYFSVRE